MPLQNRVTPFGEIVALSGRGLMMGNRGVLHDNARRIVRHSQVRRWIACRTEFRGRKRTIMQPRSYTELFFLDEVTALSAGHRPCAECRHAEYQRFRALWGAARGGVRAGADDIDLVLHAERLAGGAKRTHRAELATLPDGTFIADEIAWLVRGAELLAWSADGYARHRARPSNRLVDVLTPPSIVAVLALGYRPLVHPSAER
ncbi:MAG: hypothetical protein WA814_07210 [Candidatus Baltobacteraceae bacterium]